MANTYARITPNSNGNRKTWTFSAWVKRSNTGENDVIFSSGNSGSVEFYLRIDASDTITAYNYQFTTNTNLVTNRKFRDTNAWFHIVFTMDTTQATASNRAKLYINGVQETSLSSSTYASQNEDLVLPQTSNYIDLGRKSSGSNQHFNGLMSHVHFCDGYAYDASAFGSTDSTTGEWKINTSPSVNYGTWGFFVLKDGNSVTDQSGQGNNLTVGAGTLTKTEDCPSNVFATTNPLSTGNFKQSSNPNLASNGNTTLLENGGQHKQAPTTLAADTGKWYCEVKATSGTHGFFGACSTSLSANLGDNYSYPGNGTTGSGVSIRRSNGEKSVGGSESTYGGSAISNGDIIGIALDLTNQKIYFSKNGQWSNGSAWNSSTFDAAVGAISLPSGAGTSFDAFYQFSFSPYNSGCDINFGNGYFGTTAVSSAGSNASGIGIFEYDVPTGYTALSTKGLNT